MGSRQSNTSSVHQASALPEETESNTNIYNNNNIIIINDAKSDRTSAAATTQTNITRSTCQSQTKKGTNLTGVALIEYQCRKKKRAWGNCIKDNYEQNVLLLPGKQSIISSSSSLSSSEEEKEKEEEPMDCDELFERYRYCYMKGLLQMRQEKGLAPPKEGTLLHEFMEEEGIPIESSTKTR